MDIRTIFFQGWPGLLRTALVGVLAYLALVTLVRVSGKRTLSKMNAFDLVVTVALGSTLATILLSKDVALAEGVVAYAVLRLAVHYCLVVGAVIRRQSLGEIGSTLVGLPQRILACCHAG